MFVVSSLIHYNSTKLIIVDLTQTFLKLCKNLAACVLSSLKHLAMPHVLNPIKHCCSFFKHYLNWLWLSFLPICLGVKLEFFKSISNFHWSGISDEDSQPQTTSFCKTRCSHENAYLIAYPNRCHSTLYKVHAVCFISLQKYNNITGKYQQGQTINFCYCLWRPELSNKQEHGHAKALSIVNLNFSISRKQK